ncbi:alpha/beta-hydrolase [Aaosphaeria arxii CBS 175.79]|uniref:Alpha/beta-hydrolase n=1 Tax=Aaosphaeria arxii CBS 175.79 TaxID=1450172 RepID=A0A6A5Y3D5_9PLEO|nr:alpha/beta-hydrolase [Aaosphaeria arxii CBS 175.79]KAF2020052.1 alpha/beta-hydrolase [Aaosphaeria arxii CBS 175.79]
MHPPIPSIPAEIASKGRPRRRSSLPSIGFDAPKKRSPNYIRTQTASPEVISNLIDSLSAISSSTHNHFESLLPPQSASTPNSPLYGHFARDTLTVPDADDFDSSSYHNSIKSETFEYPDDACEPPVIRTSKPPSGLSPITAPKKKDKEHSLKSYMSRGGGSSASIHSCHSTRSVSSFGNISIEAGLPPARKVSEGSERTSSESKRSARGHRSLMYMSSRERLRSKDAERKRATIQGPELSSEHGRKPTPQLFVSEDIIKEEPTIAESSKAAQHPPKRNESPLRNGFNAADGEKSVEKGFIPLRGSSLRHSGSPSRKSKKKEDESVQQEKAKEVKAEVKAEVNAEATAEVSIKEKILKELEEEESEVAHRIRELKKQKQLRDRIAGKLPVGVDAGASAGDLHVSPLPTAEPSPTSTVSTMSEKRVQDPAKAHKVLGIAAAPPPLERRASQSQVSRESRETHNKGHNRIRSLTVNDGDDITPLPINYKLALQTLDRPPSPPLSSSASSRGTASTSSPPSRSKSLVVGGRSAVSRKSTQSMIMGAPTIHKHSHKHSASITSGGASERSLRAASEEITPRHRSLQMSSPPPPPASLSNRPGLKKKRWSHPDLPAKAEKAHNDRVEARKTMAVQSPPHPVIEERPASVDSIADDVQAYLDSPRLSQKIRHPQNGRVISFSEVGDPQGFAVFVCVGMGLTRYVMAFYDQLALTLKLRLITPDRPGIGGSQVDPNGTPLSWPDDVLVICQHLRITKFSLLAHSAGAVYALATSLRMPQHIRGRVHLLAPWIPPSQMAPIGVSQDQPPTQQLPRSQRFLRALPPSLLKVANSTFLSSTSASLQRTGPKNSPKTKRKSMNPQVSPQQLQRPPIKDTRRESIMLMDQVLPNTSSLTVAASNPGDPNHEQAKQMQEALTAAERQRQNEFDERLTFTIWDRATAKANPATDLMVCLETKQPIGFRYEDINRPVVIHHGSKDSRVPVENVRWLGKLMRRCEVRILEGEQHGLMASAQVMGNVLTEMASDWEDWTAIVEGKANGGERSVSRKRTLERLRMGVA